MHLLKRRSTRFYLAFLFVLAMTIGGAAIGAFADSGGATATLTAGQLTETGTFGETTSVTLNGQDQTASYTLPIQVTDATGSGAGWNLQISGTPLTSNSHTLTQQVRTASGTCAGSGTCTSIAPGASITYPVVIGTTGSKFFSTAANSGMGIFNVSTTVDVLVPGNSFAGTYTTTITLASVSTP